MFGHTEGDQRRGMTAGVRRFRIAPTPLSTVTPPVFKLYSADLTSLL